MTILWKKFKMNVSAATVNSNDLALELYRKIQEVSAWFVRHVEAKTIDQLRGFNPSFAQIAKLSSSTADIITTLLQAGIWDDERVMSNARQAALLMQQVAEAIEHGDMPSIQDGADRLSKMTFI
ncbi:hypothetical protein ACT9TS_12945 [Enterobacter asburiae]|uniref:hypothetical protein n=1 Tax=Enterobacter asburiae TaxID=61645 RepID=UPI001F434E53|nr:hypothetical protein [Enterobacter asburiae]BCT19838.1 hypothetical protein R2TS_30100 [Enterobacter asburiae]